MPIFCTKSIIKICQRIYDFSKYSSTFQIPFYRCIPLSKIIKNFFDIFISQIHFSFIARWHFLKLEKRLKTIKQITIT